MNVPLISLASLNVPVLASDRGVGSSPRLFLPPETHMADKKTSPKVASKASKILSSPESKPAQKSVAASDLSQAAGKAKAPAKTKATTKGPARPRRDKNALRGWQEQVRQEEVIARVRGGKDSPADERPLADRPVDSSTAGCVLRSGATELRETHPQFPPFPTGLISSGRSTGMALSPSRAVTDPEGRAVAHEPHPTSPVQTTRSGAGVSPPKSWAPCIRAHHSSLPDLTPLPRLIVSG